jgi:SAM-dependent methyltransferase
MRARLRRGLRKGRAALARPRRAQEVWRDNLSDEIEFWDSYLSTKGLEWPEDFRFKTDPESDEQDGFLIEYVRRVSSAHVSILDVGAGPLSVVGKRNSGKRVVITATDALAHEYDRLLAKEGIVPPVRTLRCHGERLLKRFSPESFDIAFARNALDHTYDPVRVISNMIELVHEGGFVLLKHRPNEAQSARYQGLHRWNFERSSDDVVVWNPEERHSLRVTFRGRATLAVGFDGEWINCALTKLTRSPQLRSEG